MEMEPEKKRRPIVGVITAGASFIEQRQILKGIVEQAQEHNFDTAVFSNIYNPNELNEKVFAENQIYTLAESQELDTIILIAESFVNEKLREMVIDCLQKQAHLPIVIIGTNDAALDMPEAEIINTNDARDIEKITDHLIEEHGFRNIDLLTGYKQLEMSHIRIDGYRKSLEKHGIPFDENKVYFGDFWMNSGISLANKYISGELPYPEAVVCTNDYMAYGMLDTFMENNIPVPEKISVIGYEYIRERHFHSPTLTTFQRNRVEIGRIAFDMIYRKITGSTNKGYNPTEGVLVPGASCPCRCTSEQLNQELKAARVRKDFEMLNFVSQMEPQLSECHTLDEFIAIAGEHHYLVRGAANILLCLADDWCESESKSESLTITFRSIIPWLDHTPSTINKYHISKIFSLSDTPAVYYFNPLFYDNRMFGYTVLKYDTPDTYDDIYRNWLKSVSNGLVFMRLKNDIRYLMECQNLSENYDSLTGIYNAHGFESAVNFTVKNAEPNQKVIILLLRVRLFSTESSFESINNSISTPNEIADILRLITQNRNDLCGRIDNNLYAFAAFGNYSEDFSNILLDKLNALIIHKTHYVKNFGLNSFTAVSEYSSTEDFSYDNAFTKLMCRIKTNAEYLVSKRELPGYNKFQKYRDAIYLNPLEDIDPESIVKNFCFSMGYFRHLYRNCFDVSFHQDCISSRMMLAKYLLCTTSLDVNVVAAKCGYDDQKYFMRLFQQSTSYTPSKYRGLFY